MSLYEVVYNKDGKVIAILEDDVAYLVPFHRSHKRANGHASHVFLQELSKRFAELATHSTHSNH